MFVENPVPDLMLPIGTELPHTVDWVYPIPPPTTTIVSLALTQGIVSYTNLRLFSHNTGWDNRL